MDGWEDRFTGSSAEDWESGKYGMSEDNVKVDDSHAADIDDAVSGKIKLSKEQQEYALKIGATHIFTDNPRGAKIENGKLMIYVHQFGVWARASRTYNWYKKKGLVKEIEFTIHRGGEDE